MTRLPADTIHNDTIRPCDLSTIIGSKNKVVIIGISGTGKSTIGRKIAALTNLPLYHMDSIIWDEKWTESEVHPIKQTLDAISETDGWIVEGWIDHYSEAIVKQSDIVLYLDFSGWLAVRGGIERWLMYRGTNRPELPAGCNESLSLKYLYNMLMRVERPHIESLLEKLEPKCIVRIKTRAEAKQLLHTHEQLI